MHAKKEGEAKVLRVVATDGHRLACVESPLPQGAENLAGVIIPRKTVTEVRKLLDDNGARQHYGFNVGKQSPFCFQRRYAYFQAD